METAIWLISGAVVGAAFVQAAFALHRFTKHLLVGGLIVAAMVYVALALNAPNPTLWVPIELVGCCIYGSAAIISLRRSWKWLLAGWGLHPIWDIAIHYVGPGHTFAPRWYSISCLSFDLVVAAYIAIRIRRNPKQPDNSHQP